MVWNNKLHFFPSSGYRGESAHKKRAPGGKAGGTVRFSYVKRHRDSS